jgi:hypothetical protein
MDPPDTVSEAVAFLEAEGYTEELRLGDRCLRCVGDGSSHALADAIVDHTFRFEGPSDPADEAIVLGIRLPSSGIKGMLVAAYGPEADPEETDMLTALAHQKR